MAPNSYRTASPTWDELDAICKGKSAMDLAEEIWRLRREVPECPFPWTGDDGSVRECIAKGHCGCVYGTDATQEPK